MEELRKWSTDQLKRKVDLEVGIKKITEQLITPEQLLIDLQALQPPAPSGTVLYTRTPIIRRLLIEAGVSSLEMRDDFLNSGSPAVFLNTRDIHEDPIYSGALPKTLWFDAHSDQPGYVFPKPTNDKELDILPICAHRPTDVTTKFPAVVLRYDPEKRQYQVASEGIIGTRDEKNLQPYYKSVTGVPEDGFNPGLDRIAYNVPLVANLETRLITGNMDNAAGVAACIAAIRAFTKIVKNNFNGASPEFFNVGWVFPDYEEGLPSETLAFSKGARQIVGNLGNQIPVPGIVINIDGHDTPNPPSVALLGSYVSKGKGAIVSPDTYAEITQFLGYLKDYGINTLTTESVNGASLSRSDDPAWAGRVRDVVPLGYGVCDPHHNKGMATVNIDSLVNLAKIMTWMAVASGFVPNAW